tara:strand:+ start:586 stop:1509 length:924 start_codon:yes stop_codon:yes gene_type:complete
MSQESTTFDDEIDLLQLIEVLWKKKIFIILVTSIFAIFSVFYALSLKNIYKSEAIVHIPESEGGETLSGIGGLASMAGINISPRGMAKSAIAIETIKSRAFLKHLISFENVLPELMAPEKYDSELRKTVFDKQVYDEKTSEWVRKNRSNNNSKPTYLEAFQIYNKLISVREDKNNGLLVLSFEHISPVFAEQFLSLIIKEVNELLRNKDLQESSDAIAFLSSEIPKSSLITMKDAINQLVQSKLETQMMARISSEYILKIIEPPFVPEKKFKPVRSMICIFGTLLGGLLAVIIVLIRHYFFNDLTSK